MSGIDALRGMNKRRVPTPRHPREDSAPEATAAPITTPARTDSDEAPDDDTLPEFDISSPIPVTTARSQRSTPTTMERGGEESAAASGHARHTPRQHVQNTPPARTEATATQAEATPPARGYQRREEEQVNLGVRVPRDLDNKLMGLVYHLRLQGVRASKAELVALALAQLPPEPTPALTQALHKQRP